MRCARLGVWMLAALVAIACASGCKRRSVAPTAPMTDPAHPVVSGAPKAEGGAEPAREGTRLLLRGGRVMTAAGVIYPKADVLVIGDRIEAVGVALPVPKGATVLDVQGKTITPGLIDTHSHIGVYAAPGFTGTSDGNETSSPSTADVQAADGYWPQDPQIERARQGGVTTMQILPGSANLVGGRSVVVKTYPRARSVEDARFRGAPDGLKIACGQNPKPVHGQKGGPVTRMGNVARMRAVLQQAVEYRRAWKRYRDKLERWNSRPVEGGDAENADPPDPPARDFGLETLVKVIDGDILVHNHCYRADEMSLMMDLAESYGFRIRSFHHAVEAYKIADRLAAHGAAASVWADWWGFKAEAFDGIRENAAMVAAAGGRAVIHSDSALGIQRLNQEASKAMHAGRRAGLDVSDDEALRWLTANPAWALGIDGTVGTLEPGKQADLVVWDGDPFSVYTKAARVYIEGELVFDREHPGAPSSDFELGYPARKPARAKAASKEVGT
jgi:imidazolonepropionase-like amidohydrolase